MKTEGNTVMLSRSIQRLASLLALLLAAFTLAATPPPSAYAASCHGSFYAANIGLYEGGCADFENTSDGTPFTVTFASVRETDDGYAITLVVSAGKASRRYYVPMPAIRRTDVPKYTEDFYYVATVDIKLISPGQTLKLQFFPDEDRTTTGVLNISAN